MSRRTLVGCLGARRSLKGGRPPAQSQDFLRPCNLSPATSYPTRLLCPARPHHSSDICTCASRCCSAHRSVSCCVRSPHSQRTSTLILPRRALRLRSSQLIQTYTNLYLAMDLTIAQAVARASEDQQQQQAAAAQQAQQLINQPSPPVQPVQSASSTIDNLTCQWQGCGERCDSAEALYVCVSSCSNAA